MLYSNVHDLEYRTVKDGFSYYSCDNCKTVTINPFPDLERVLSYYPPDYHCYNNEVRYKSTAFSYMKSLYRKLFVGGLLSSLDAEGKKVLEVGCADGFQLMRLANLYHFIPFGVEPNRLAFNLARERGVNVENCVLRESSFKDNSFDVILLLHMIEHDLEPLLLIKKCYDLLKPGGILVGETPVVDCWEHFVCRRHWGGLHTPRHLCLFNRESLKMVLEKGNFREIKITSTLDPSHWVIAIQNGLLSKGVDVRLKYGKSKYYNIMIPLFVMVNALSIPFNKAGVVSFSAQKSEA